MNVKLTMLIALQSYRQLCSQAKSLIRSNNLSFKSHSFLLTNHHAKRNAKNDNTIILSLLVPRGGGFNHSTNGASCAFISSSPGNNPLLVSESLHMQSEASAALQQPLANDYATISGELKAAKFGDRSYVSTADVITTNQHRVVFVLGGPGSGKGTQCDRIVKHYKCIHLSAGDLLRQEREKNGKYAKAIEEAIVAGKIVPVEITLGLLADAMNNQKSEQQEEEYGSAFFLVDGFPRNYDNLDGWTSLMKDKACVLGLLVLNCPVEELERRILGRGETSGRSDDNLASARKRFATFEEQTMPVIRELQHTNFSIGPIDFQIAGDRSEADVWKDIKVVMDRLVLNDVLTANQRLLDAVSKYDWASYLDLVDHVMLWPAAEDSKKKGPNYATDSELEQNFLRLEYVKNQNISEHGVNVLSNVQADIMGINAVISYDRSILKGETNQVLSKMHETRVWHHTNKGWLNVHFVRRPIQ